MTSAEIKKVAVVGAGTMGQGIAQVCAQAGMTTSLFDINSELMQAGIQRIHDNLQAAVAKNKITTAEAAHAIRLLQPVSQPSEIKADLIIEAVAEKLEVKQELFLQLEKNNSEQTILASNTSSLSITSIGSVLKRPENFLGLHFFNPAHFMKLVEIISGAATHPDRMKDMKTFVNRLGKISVVAKDSPGFIVNRVARHYYLESLKLLEDNISGTESMDALLRSSGFKMGPFELMDLIGIDINLAVTRSVYDGFHRHTRFRPSEIQVQKVKDGHLGRKTGKGFYEYPKK